MGVDRALMSGWIEGSLSALIVSAAAAWGLIRFKDRVPLIDHPNARSSHSVPKPRSGGIAVAAGIVVGAWAAGGMPAPIAAAAAGFFLLGLADDLRPLPEAVRLVAQICLAAFVVRSGAVNVIPTGLPERVDAVLPGTLAFAAAVFWIVGFVNVFNFMDGIDGYAPGKAVLGGLALALLGGPAHVAVAAAAVAGLLAFNFPPSRIFMGDGGSYLLGFLLAAACIGQRGGVPAIALTMPFGSFLIDAALTLTRRMLTGEKWYKAHRSHYYQRATSLGLSHRTVSLTDYALTVVGAGAGALYAFGPTGTSVRASVLAAWAGLHLAFAAAISAAERAVRMDGAGERHP